MALSWWAQRARGHVCLFELPVSPRVYGSYYREIEAWYVRVTQNCTSDVCLMGVNDSVGYTDSVQLSDIQRAYTS